MHSPYNLNARQFSTYLVELRPRQIIVLFIHQKIHIKYIIYFQFRLFNEACWTLRTLLIV